MDNKRIKIRITKWNVLMSAFLVILNSFSTNPPFEWNLVGWFWMTFPFMYAVYLFIVLWIISGIANVIDYYLR